MNHNPRLQMTTYIPYSALIICLYYHLFNFDYFKANGTPDLNKWNFSNITCSSCKLQMWSTFYMCSHFIYVSLHIIPSPILVGPWLSSINKTFQKPFNNPLSFFYILTIRLLSNYPFLKQIIKRADIFLSLSQH